MGRGTKVQAETFEAFVRNCIVHFPGLAGQVFDKYSKGATYIGRMEVLRESLIHILTMIGERVDPSILYRLPPDNLGSSIPQFELQSRYNPQLLQDLLKVEEDTLRRYGYSFDPPR